MPLNRMLATPVHPASLLEVIGALIAIVLVVSAIQIVNARQAADKPPGGPRCGRCGRGADECKVLIAGPRTHLCDMCAEDLLARGPHASTARGTCEFCSKADQPLAPDAGIALCEACLDTTGDLLVERSRLAELSKTIEMTPDDADALAQRAQIHLDGGRTAEARRDLDQALAARPGSADLFARRADLRALGGDLDGAAEDAASALGINPKLVDAYACRAYCNILRERFADALADAEAGLAHDKGAYAAVLHNNRARGLQGLGRYEEALAAIDTAIAIEGSVPKFHENRATILRALGREP